MKNKTKLSFKETCCLLLLGLLAGVPLVWQGFSLLIFILFAPFAFYLLVSLEKGMSIGHCYLRALFFFQGYFMMAFSFFFAMYPLDFVGLSNFASLLVVLAATVFLPLMQASVLALSVLLLGWLYRRFTHVFAIPSLYALTFASLCTVFFYLQNFTWLGVPWAMPANALSSHLRLIQTASLFGGIFLTFLILFCGALIAESVLRFCKYKNKKSLFCGVLALGLFCANLLTGTMLYALPTTSEETLNVAILQGNVPMTEMPYPDSANIVYKYFDLALQASAQAQKDGIRIDLMLWTETIAPASLEESPSVKNKIQTAADLTGAVQIVGTWTDRSVEDDFVCYNSLIAVAPQTGISEEIYDKRRLVPFGEYIPWPDFFENVFPVLTEIRFFAADALPGDDSNLFSLFDSKLGGLICFDSIYAALARDSVRDGAELLLLATNDSWFDGSSGKSIHFSHAVLRAVENGRTVVRAGNTGISAVIGPHGDISSAILPDTTAYSIGQVSLYSENTLYTNIGDIIVYLCAAWILCLPLLSFLLKRKEKNNDR